MRECLYALEILAILLVLKPNVTAGKDVEDINVSSHVPRIGCHFEMDECIHFSRERCKIAAEESWIGGKQTVNAFMEAEFQSVGKLGYGGIVPFNKRSVPATKDIACRVGKRGTSADTVFDAEKCDLDKSIAWLDLFAGVNLVRIDSETVERIQFKEGCDSANIFAVPTSTIGGGADEIGAGKGVAWRLSREDKIDGIISSENLASVGFADGVASQISEGDFCICADQYLGGEEIYHNSCSMFDLRGTEMEEKKQDWKYFRMRFHDLRISTNMDVPRGFVHNSWSCDLDVSEDAKTWYHVAGECYDEYQH